MKKTIYLSLCALFFITIGTLRAGATGTITMHMDGSFCSLALDSMTVVEGGYTSGDSIIVYWGDGTSSSSTPFTTASSSAWYAPTHFYSAGGTYSRKIILYSGGVGIDSVTYSYTWTPCELMRVLLYDDVNSDCMLDGGDVYLWTPGTVEIDSAGIPVDTQTVTSWASYIATGPIGTVYTFKVITNPHGFLPSCPSTGLVNITVSSTNGIYSDTIGFKCDTAVCTDNAVSANFCAGQFWGSSFMVVTSTSCSPVSTTLDMTFSPKYTVAAVYGASSYSVSGQVLTMTVPAVSSSTPAYLAVDFNAVGTLSIGDTVNTSWKLNPYTGDCDTTNNYVYSLDTIHLSYDPNHKSVEPVGDITAGTQLKYMISFQNTGNAPAQNIHIMDTLSDNVNINTIKQVGSSARVNMTLLTYGTHNVVKFDFPNINLPDSSHHAASEGFVEFTINTMPGLAPGTLIDNKAGIYFDVNPVVITNNVENKIRTSTTGTSKVTVNSLEVYPNPVSDVLTINAVNGSYGTITISNAIGQIKMTQQFSNTLTRINVSSLPSGMYYITLKGESGIKVQKFEKL